MPGRRGTWARRNDAMRNAAPPARAERAFEWTAAEIRRVGYRAVDLIAEHLTRLPDGPAFRPVPPELADALLGAPVPDEGRSADEILDEFARDVEPYPPSIRTSGCTCPSTLASSSSRTRA